MAWALEPLTLNVDEAFRRVGQTAALNDADWTFMNTFASRGKLILYQGVSDYGLSAKGLAAWYDRIEKDTGGTTQEWARLFLVPGMSHCDGGPQRMPLIHSRPFKTGWSTVRRRIGSSPPAPRSPA